MKLIKKQRKIKIRDFNVAIATLTKASEKTEWKKLNKKIKKSIVSLNRDCAWVVDWDNLKEMKNLVIWEHTAKSTIIFTCTDKQFVDDSYYMCGTAANELCTLYTQEEFKFWITKERTK